MPMPPRMMRRPVDARRSMTTISCARGSSGTARTSCRGGSAPAGTAGTLGSRVARRGSSTNRLGPPARVRHNAGERRRDRGPTVEPSHGRWTALERATDEVRKLRTIGVAEALEESGEEIMYRTAGRVDVEPRAPLVPDTRRAVRADDFAPPVVRLQRPPVGLDVRKRAALDTHRVERGVRRVLVSAARVAE